MVFSLLAMQVDFIFPHIHHILGQRRSVREVLHPGGRPSLGIGTIDNAMFVTEQEMVEQPRLLLRTHVLSTAIVSKVERALLVNLLSIREESTGFCPPK